MIFLKDPPLHFMGEALGILYNQTIFVRTWNIFYSCVFGKRNYRVLVRVCVCVCVCVCVSPCLCACEFLHDNSKRNQCRNTKLEYIVAYENSSDEFDIGLHRIKVKVTVGVQNFPHLPQYKLLGPKVQLFAS